MPEEINRVLSDRVSTLLMCPTKTAVKNLKIKELSSFLTSTKKLQTILWTGDVMYDAVLFYKKLALRNYKYEDMNLEYKNYIFVQYIEQKIQMT